jgi:hypothetical protein
MQTEKQLADLTNAAHDLIDGINALKGETGEQLIDLSKRSQANRRYISLIAVSLFLDVALTVGLLLGANKLDNSNQQLTHLTHRLDVAQHENRKATCSEFGLFLGLKSDRARKAFAKGPEAYDKTFKIFEDGYRDLDCRNVKVN